jgi:hypothetical protein
MEKMVGGKRMRLLIKSHSRPMNSTIRKNARRQEEMLGRRWRKRNSGRTIV